MNNDFLKHWEPAEVAAPGSDGWTTARVSSLCLECAKLDEGLVCEVRGFQMDMAPPVYACLEYAEAKKEPDANQRSVCGGKGATVSPLSIGQDGECEGCETGSDADMAPPVYACLEYAEAKKEPEENQVEIHRTFTVEVTQILKVGRSEAKAAELNMRGKSEEDLERAAAASLGAESVKVRDLKVWVLDR